MNTRTLTAQERTKLAPAEDVPNLAVAPLVKRSLLGPTYARIQDALNKPGLLDPKRVPEMVFDVLNNPGANRLQNIAAMAACLKARSGPASQPEGR